MVSYRELNGEIKITMILLDMSEENKRGQS